MVKCASSLAWLVAFNFFGAVLSGGPNNDVVDPKDPAAVYKRATLHLASGKDQLAVAELGRVLALDPNFAPAQYHLAAVQFRLGHGVKAREVIENCTDPRCAEVASELHEYDQHISVARTSEDDCIYEASEALKLAPKSAQALKIRAHCRLQRNLAIEAVNDLTQVVSLDPSDEETCANVAKVQFLVLNQQKAALALLRKCITRDPEGAKEAAAASKTLRKIDIRKTPYKKLVQLVREAAQSVGMDPDEGELASDLLDGVRHDRCEKLARKSDWDRAAKICAQVRDRDPEFLPALLVQARLEKNSGNLRAAMQLAQKLLRSTNDPQVRELYEECQAEMYSPRQGAPQKDLYKVLGVEQSADQREIRKAYRELSRKYHPDKYRGSDLSEDEVMAKMQDINEAYETLGNAERRKDYDDQRRSGHSRGGQGGGFHQGGGFQGGFPADAIFQQFAHQFGGGGGGGNFHFNF